MSERKHYALLTHSTDNLGDDIQSLAASRLLPSVDAYLDRDHLHSLNTDNTYDIILHGWFLDKPLNWPPSVALKPMITSLHISHTAEHHLTSSKSLAYLKHWEPIGCRDTHTRDLLTHHGIQAYFSGCLSLTLTNPAKKRDDGIYLVDVFSQGIEPHELPSWLQEQGTVLTHLTYQPTPLNHFLTRARAYCRVHMPRGYQLAETIGINHIINKIIAMPEQTEERFSRTTELLHRYGSAKLVITSRLHCALPCLAFGTPVIFVHKNLDDPRFSGLLPYLHHYTPDAFRSLVSTLDPDHIPENPKSINTLRDELLKTVSAFLRR